LNQVPGEREVYNLLHGRSNYLLDYDYKKIAEKHPGEMVVPLNEIESVFYTNKYDAPVRLLAHTPGDKISVLYTNMINPNFMMKKYYSPFKSLTSKFPQLKTLPSFEDHKLSMNDIRSQLQFTNEINRLIYTFELLIYLVAS